MLQVLYLDARTLQKAYKAIKAISETLKFQVTQKMLRVKGICEKATAGLL